MSMLIPGVGIKTIIVSAQRDHLNPVDNYHRHQSLVDVLARDFQERQVFAVLQCCGFYKGSREQSIAVIAPSGYLYKALGYGRAFDQETVLCINQRGVGKLIWCEGCKVETLGEYTSLRSDETPDHDATGWTHVVGTHHRFTFT